MPDATLEAVADHGRVGADTGRGTYETSRATLDGPDTKPGKF